MCRVAAQYLSRPLQGSGASPLASRCAPSSFAGDSPFSTTRHRSGYRLVSHVLQEFFSENKKRGRKNKKNTTGFQLLSWAVFAVFSGCSLAFLFLPGTDFVHLMAERPQAALQCPGPCVDGRRRNARELLCVALWIAVAICLLAPAADAQARTREKRSGRGGRWGL